MPIKIVFDGDFVDEHRISLRTLAQTYYGTQKAIERAYMDIARGGLTKGATITHEERRATDFYLDYEEEGCFIATFREKTSNLLRAVDKLIQSIQDPYSIAIAQGDIMYEQILSAAMEKPVRPEDSIRTYEEAISGGSESYVTKSISNYMNESLYPIKHNDGNNSIHFYLIGHTSADFYFDAYIAERFTKAISGKGLGEEMKYESYVEKLDIVNMKGRIRHKVNDKCVSVFFLTTEDYNSAVEYNKIGEDGKTPDNPMKFVGISVTEFGSSNFESSDVIFKKLLG